MLVVVAGLSGRACLYMVSAWVQSSADIPGGLQDTTGSAFPAMQGDTVDQIMSTTYVRYTWLLTVVLRGVNDPN